MPARTWHTFPDIEGMAGKVMRDAGVASGRVYSSLPTSPVWPLVTFSRLGGIPAVERRLDRARIQVETWGNNKGEARSLAEAARLALHKAQGTAVPSFAGFITGVEDELGLIFLPDPPTGKDRYVFAVGIYAISTTT
jgi:hypothetical protein